MTSSKDASTSLLWHEPIERLEFSELFLGGMASTYFARGRPSGYGFCFTDRRIIGFRMRRVSLAVEAPFLGLIGVLYLAVLFEFISGTAVLLGFLLPLILHAANIPITWLTNGISESVLSRRARDTSKLLKRRRDFELRRNQIGELLMKSPGKCPSMLRTGGAGGYLRITPTDYRSKPIEIKVHRWTQHQRLRDLVISFSSREPKVRALEYP